MRVVNHIEKAKQVKRKYNKTYDKNTCIHDLLLCLIAIANNKIVPGQWAEYCAPAKSPVIPNPMEYIIQMNASIIG